MLAQYAHALRVGGRLYTITDVEDLHQWMASHCDRHPLLRRLSEEEMVRGAAVRAWGARSDHGARGARLPRADECGWPLTLPVAAFLQRADPAVAIMFEETEEAKKVARGGGEKMAAVYERVEGPAGGEGTWEEFWGEGA